MAGVAVAVSVLQVEPDDVMSCGAKLLSCVVDIAFVQSFFLLRNLHILLIYCMFLFSYFLLILHVFLLTRLVTRTRLSMRKVAFQQGKSG